MKITVYSTAVCPKCAQLKNYLGEKGVEFEEVNLTVQREKMAELQQVAPGVQMVPVIVFKNEDGSVRKFLQGFDEFALDAEF